ncbi:MAG TPA: hypothetical protein VLH10_18670 [Yinghuangia sp.]|uniref:hypothetical protein n=1 Tax=Yinghuangia sp. YIM S10712 TaxID=3436930 RepID=UPI002B92787D|nr:hypothetical protein [Yinghuangia sp.]
MWADTAPPRGFVLVAIAALLAESAYHCWHRVERAMRLGQALPGTSMPLMLSSGVATVVMPSTALMAVG